MTDDFLKKLQSAKNDDERSWLVTQNLLNSLSENVQRAVFAAAIPHWFNEEILKALLPDMAEQIDNIYITIQKLPFVEPFEGRGHNIHDLTRKLLLENIEVTELTNFSSRAEKYFQQQLVELSSKDTSPSGSATDQRDETTLHPNLYIKAEYLFHHAVSTQKKLPEKAEKLVKSREADYQKILGDSYLRLWNIPEARSCYEKAFSLYHNIDDKFGEANCTKSLGNVHVSLSELPEARARYEQALHLYRAIGDKLGEANCVQSLGDVHVSLSELPEARARYEEAQPLYRAIGAKIGEANCIKALGDVHNKLSELPEARARYEQALPLYRAIGAKIGEINCILGFGDVATEEKSFDLAVKLAMSTIELAQNVSPAQVAGTYNNLAIIYEKKKDYPKAIEFYTKAMQLFTGSHAYMIRNRANVFIKMEDAQNAEKDILLAENIQPINPFLFLRKGELANLKENFDEAIVHFNRAIELIPRFSAAFFGIGLSNLRSGKPQEAKASYQQGLSYTDAVDELEDTIEELEKLQSRQPKLEGVEEILNLLKNWRPER